MADACAHEGEQNRSQLAARARQEAQRPTGAVLHRGQPRHRLRPVRVGGADGGYGQRVWREAVGSPDRLREALAVDRDHACRRLDHRGRASVVRREHHAPRRRVVVREAEDSADVGEAPRVDRLVVVADDEEVVLRRRQHPDEAELGGVDVLELVDADVREARPASDGGRRDRSRAGHRRARRGRRSRRHLAHAAAPHRFEARRRPRAVGLDPRPSRRTATCRAGRPPAVESIHPPRRAAAARPAEGGDGRRGCSSPRRRRAGPVGRGRAGSGSRSTWRPAPAARGASLRAPRGRARRPG